jgi:predicted outer membrane lipoprotein
MIGQGVDGMITRIRIDRVGIYLVLGGLIVGCAFASLSALAAERTEGEREFVNNARLLLGTDTARSASVRIGDIDGDGDLDVVVANGRHWPQQNVLCINQGRASFNVIRKLGEELATSYATELADLDGDGDLDIAVGNDRAPNRVFLNDGLGHFAPHSIFGTISSIRSLTLADVDGDGDVDILANSRGAQNMIYYNDGAAHFDAGQPFGRGDDSTIDVAFADINGDGHGDLVLANRDHQQNYVLLNDGENGFNDRVPFGTGRDETRAVAVADLDGDGNLDLVTGNIGEPNAVFKGDGKGGFSDAIMFGREDGRTYAVSIQDMDNDGSPDLIVGNAGQENAVFFNQGDGERFQETRLQRGNPDRNDLPNDGDDESSITYGIAVGDLDGDGYLDIAVANSDAQNVIFLNRPRRN